MTKKQQIEILEETAKNMQGSKSELIEFLISNMDKKGRDILEQYFMDNERYYHEYYEVVVEKINKLKVTYYFQGLDDSGSIIDGIKTKIIETERELEYFKNAKSGHTFGSEYIKTESIIEA